MKKHIFLVGAHMSISGGFYKAIIRGESIGCTTIQIFTKSNRQWKAKIITPDEIKQFKNTLAQSTIVSVVVHASYLINIGSDNPELYQKSIDSLQEELQRCQLLGIPYLVLHPGAGKDPSVTVHNIAQALDCVLEQNPGKTTILLENTAGQGSVYGSTLEQLGILHKKIKAKDRIGFCIDTCHAFVAGYDISNVTGYTKFWHDFETHIGLKHLKALHLNDSKKGLLSHLDRHEHIGKGAIGLEAFSLLCNDKRFFDIPKILETPKDEDHTMTLDLMNIQVLKELVHTTTREELHVNFEKE